MNNSLKILFKFFYVATFLVTTACSPKGFVSARISAENSQPDQNPHTTPVEIEALKPTEKSQTKDAPSSVELLWQIPTQPVDGFVIKLGYSREHLDKELRVNTSNLERFEDPKHGYVYRYVLRDIPRSHPLYVSMSAFRGENVSPASEVFELQAASETIE